MHVPLEYTLQIVFTGISAFSAKSLRLSFARAIAISSFFLLTFKSLTSFIISCICKI
nr:MAG TPA_asm: hypothetical protein [Caudoviricetes sp.]